MRAHLLFLLSSSRISSSSSSFHHICCFRYSSLLHFSSSSSQNPHSIFIDYLIDTYGFSKTQVDSVSKYIQSRKVPKKPDSFAHLLREFGFSETQIRKAVLLEPQILFANVDKTLKPKLSVFQKELGLTGSDLGRFISNNPSILNVSLERRLIPNINLVKTIIPKIQNEDNWKITQCIPQQCRRFFAVDPKIFSSSISYFQSCGIVRDQLSTILKHNASLFTRKESTLKDLVCKAQQMGFSSDSRMLVYALSALGRVSWENVERKFKLLSSLGFSQEECLAMFRSAPFFFNAFREETEVGHSVL